MLDTKEDLSVIEYPNDPGLLTRVISPYKENVKYMKTSTLTLAKNGCLTGNAHFHIPESCYIDDTGHFNSVEFNICYNQLMYFSIAKSVKEQTSEMFSHFDMDSYWRRQLPDILIVDFKSSFKRPLNSKSFFGEIEFVSSRMIRSVQYINTLIRFTDDSEGYCEGMVKLAIVNN